MIRRAGLTLLELLVVLFILVALAGLVVPLVGDTSSKTETDVTTVNMNRLSDLIMNTYRNHMSDKRLPRPGPVGINNGHHNHPQLRYLFVNPGTTLADPISETTNATYNPVTKLGWQGPYLMRAVGTYPTDADSVARGFTIRYGGTGNPADTPDPTVLDGWGRPIVIDAVLFPRTDGTGNEVWTCLISAGVNQLLELPGNVIGSSDDIARQLYRGTP